MIEKTSPDEGTEKKPAAKSETKAAAKPEPKKAEPKVEPTVETAPEIKRGQKVRHANGKEYQVLEVMADGVKLANVANLVHPSALEPLRG